MAYFKIAKENVLTACEAFLADKKNHERDDVGQYLYTDILEVQRLYDLLRSNVYNHTQGIALETFEVELLSQYLPEV